MKAEEKKSRLVLFLLMCSLLVTAVLSPVPFCMAGDHGEGGKRHDRHSGGDKNGDGGLRGLWGGRGHDEGNETTGQIVAWSLAAANLSVALSVIIRGLRRVAPLGPETAKSLLRFNSTQKKHLMRFHYVLNPLILLIAILHWTLSSCRSTTLPEWGLLTMGAIAVLGIILKFKICPKTSLRTVYQVHTHPMLILVLVSLLVFGHLSMD